LAIPEHLAAVSSVWSDGSTFKSSVKRRRKSSQARASQDVMRATAVVAVGA